MTKKIKIIMINLIVSILAINLVGCAKEKPSESTLSVEDELDSAVSDNWFEEIGEPIEVTESMNSEEDQSLKLEITDENGEPINFINPQQTDENKPKPLTECSSEWKDMNVVLAGGVVYQLPVKVKDVYETSKLTLLDYDKDTTLKPNEIIDDVLCDRYFTGPSSISIAIRNNSDKEQNIMDCEIFELSIGGTNGAGQIAGIATRMTKLDVIKEKFGKPNNIREGTFNKIWEYYDIDEQSETAKGMSLYIKDDYVDDFVYGVYNNTLETNIRYNRSDIKNIGQERKNIKSWEELQWIIDGKTLSLPTHVSVLEEMGWELIPDPETNGAVEYFYNLSEEYTQLIGTNKKYPGVKMYIASTPEMIFYEDASEDPFVTNVAVEFKEATGAVPELSVFGIDKDYTLEQIIKEKGDYGHLSDFGYETNSFYLHTDKNEEAQNFSTDDIFASFELNKETNAIEIIKIEVE